MTVRVRPGASRTRVGGRWGDQEVLGVSVGARAVDGAATAAVRAAAAFALCMENNLPMMVFNMNDEGAVTRALRGEMIGTLVHA